MNQSSSNDQASAVSLHLATAPVNWNNNDIPGWRPLTPFPHILDRMVEAGYSATEYDDGFGTDVDRLIHESASRGMTWTGCYQWIDFLDAGHIEAMIANLRPKLSLLQTIGCRNLIVADSLRSNRVALAGRVPADGSQSLKDYDVARIADGVHLLARTAEAFEIAVHYHNHVGSWIEAPHEVAGLMKHLDLSVADFCFDTGHYAYGGGDAAAFIRDNRSAIGYLHLKDVDTASLADSRTRGLTFIEALQRYVFSPIGTGSANIPGILETLVSTDFGGWVVVEQDTCAGDATATARSNLHFITEWLSVAGKSVTSGRKRV